MWSHPNCIFGARVRARSSRLNDCQCFGVGAREVRATDLPLMPLQTERIDPRDFVFVQEGGLPILLAAPHGGWLDVPGVPVRKAGTRVTDAKTFELTRILASGLENLFGRPVYVVAAKFRRRYVDANRAESVAFEDPAAWPVYDFYHRHMKEFITRLNTDYPGGALLVDIHGQSQEQETVHRGTRDGRTVEKLIERHGNAALSGPNSIFGALQARGYNVFPEAMAACNPPEDRRFNGKHTIATYGSHNRDGVDAIQLEIGIRLREDDKFPQALVEALGLFYQSYLAER